jgi:hypothetical protein
VESICPRAIATLTFSLSRRSKAGALWSGRLRKKRVRTRNRCDEFRHDGLPGDEREARDAYRQIIEQGDWEATRNIVRIFGLESQSLREVLRQYQEWSYPVSVDGVGLR